MNGDIIDKAGNSDEQSQKSSSTVHWLSKEQRIICRETDLSTTVQLEEIGERNSKAKKIQSRTVRVKESYHGINVYVKIKLVTHDQQ